jgi:hypothetical protein
MGRLLRGHCPSCTASRDLVEMFTQPDGQPASALVPLVELLAHYDNPYSLCLYLRRPGGQLIRRIVAGEPACSHEALDALAQTTAVQHLRGLLVLAEILPPREEELAQFTRDIHEVAIGTSARTGDREIMSDTDRVLLAVRLETDDTVALVDRVAGCLVLQYGQPLRLVNLTTEHVLVHPDEPDVLGRDPLWLRPRLSALLRRLAPAAGRSPTTSEHALPVSGDAGRPTGDIGSAARATAQAGHPQHPHRPQRRMAGVGRLRALEDACRPARRCRRHRQRLAQGKNGGDHASYVATRLRQQHQPAGPT